MTWSKKCISITGTFKILALPKLSWPPLRSPPPSSGRLVDLTMWWNYVHTLFWIYQKNLGTGLTVPLPHFGNARILTAPVFEIRPEYWFSSCRMNDKRDLRLVQLSALVRCYMQHVHSAPLGKADMDTLCTTQACLGTNHDAILGVSVCEYQMQLFACFPGWQNTAQARHPQSRLTLDFRFWPCGPDHLF